MMPTVTREITIPIPVSTIANFFRPAAKYKITPANAIKNPISIPKDRGMLVSHFWSLRVIAENKGTTCCAYLPQVMHLPKPDLGNHSAYLEEKQVMINVMLGTHRWFIGEIIAPGF